MLEVATWRSNSVFASFYFRDISYAVLSVSVQAWGGQSAAGPFAFFKDCGLLARLSRRAVSLTPCNFIFGRVFNSGDKILGGCFDPAELGLRLGPYIRVPRGLHVWIVYKCMWLAWK